MFLRVLSNCFRGGLRRLSAAVIRTEKASGAVLLYGSVSSTLWTRSEGFTADVMKLWELRTHFCRQLCVCAYLHPNNKP